MMLQLLKQQRSFVSTSLKFPSNKIQASLTAGSVRQYGLLQFWDGLIQPCELCIISFEVFPFNITIYLGRSLMHYTIERSSEIVISTSTT